MPKLWLTGANGMMGRALLAQQHLLPGWEWLTPTSRALDLRDRTATFAYAAAHKPDVVIHAAAKVGGIRANMADQAGFLAENLLINTHVLEAAHAAGVQRLLFMSSSCVYPRDYLQPLKEDYLLAAPLEPTNEGYAIAKIAGGKLAEYLSQQYGHLYRTIIPSNLYGPFDHFDSDRSHLVPAIISKLHRAKQTGAAAVEILGDGTPRREFLFINDLAAFLLSLIDRLDSVPPRLNVGFGRDYTVTEYYETAAHVMGYTGGFQYQPNIPGGMQHKLIDSSLAHTLGWQPKTDLTTGIALTYENYISLQKDTAI
jgi:GDP-L-fucose synthase